MHTARAHPRPHDAQGYTGLSTAAVAVTSLLLAFLAAGPPGAHALHLPPGAIVGNDGGLDVAAVQDIGAGVSGAEAQGEVSVAGGTWGGSRRTLLHGKRRPSSYRICPLCTPITCSTAAGTCTGHCKSDRTLFTCLVRGRVAGGCPPGEDPPADPRTLTPDAINTEELGSVQVRAAAPFIGCANITGAPDGCPDAGTTGTLDGGGVTVLSSWCVQHLYELECPRGGTNPTPFHPFGYCKCLLRFASGKVAVGPCRLPSLDWSGPAGGEDAVPVSVSLEGNETVTAFAETEEADFRLVRLNHTFSTRGLPIFTELSVFISFPFTADDIDIDAEGPLPGAGGEAEEEAGGDFVEEEEPEDVDGAGDGVVAAGDNVEGQAELEEEADGAEEEEGEDEGEGKRAKGGRRRRKRKARRGRG